MGRSAVCVGLFAVVVAACGGPAGAPVAPPGASDPAEAHVAEVTVLDEHADRQTAGTGPFEAAATGDLLFTSDVMRTDAVGFVQIDYTDGSVTRLDADTEFEIVALAESVTARQVRTRLTVGRVFVRVSEQDPGGAFSVETSVGVAAVRGTEFVVACPGDGSCTFTVVDGDVTVSVGGEDSELGPGDRLVVRADGTSDGVQRVGVEQVLADPWVARNHAADEPGDETSEEASAAGVDVSGEWEFTVDVTVANGVCDGEEDDPPYNLTVLLTQDGERLEVRGFDADGVWTGSVTGRTVSFAGTSAEDDGTTTSAVTLELSADGTSMEGLEEWSWEADGMSCPDGESQVIAVKR